VHRKAIVLVGIAVFLFAAVGATRLTVETNTLRFFRPESSIRQATEVVDKSFGGSENLSLIIDGDIKSPEVLNSMLALQSWAEELPQVGYTVSIADYVAQINQSLLDNDPSQHVIPATSNAVAQEILLYEMSGAPSDFSRVVNYNYAEARIAMRMESLTSSQLANLIDEVNSKAVNAANGGFGVKITGSSYLFKVLTDLLVHGQILSLLVSLLGVALVVGLIFRSVRFGLLSMIPLGFTITLNFGMMGWLGIPLDTATTMLASIAIGIGVDYTVHFLSKYRQQRREGVEPQNAVSETIRTTGRAIIYNAIAVAAGFAVLLFSSFGPIATLGGLVAVTMGISSLAALTLLPSALLLIKKKV
jgi:predicted RND superfamily exporter protein